MLAPLAFVFLAVSESFSFKIWCKNVPLSNSRKLCLLRYRGAEVTLSSVNKVKYIKIGRNKNEIFSSPAFPCSANLRRSTKITIVNTKGILVSIPNIKFFGACEAQVNRDGKQNNERLVSYST